MPAERRGYTLSTKNIGNKNILTHIKKIIVCQCIVQNTGDTISVVIKVDGEIGEIWKISQGCLEHISLEERKGLWQAVKLKNIVLECPLLSLWPDVYMMRQKLSEESCSQLFKPSTVTSHINSRGGQDELLIPDTELQRIHSLGRKHKHTHTYTHSHTHRGRHLWSVSLLELVWCSTNNSNCSVPPFSPIRIWRSDVYPYPLQPP